MKPKLKTKEKIPTSYDLVIVLLLSFDADVFVDF
jgi:hypothetical protein